MEHGESVGGEPIARWSQRHRQDSEKPRVRHERHRPITACIGVGFRPDEYRAPIRTLTLQRSGRGG
jgi:hypothetical protein